MWEDYYPNVSKSTSRRDCHSSSAAYEEGLAVLLEVGLIGIHHAVQPWQQFPDIVNQCFHPDEIVATHLAQWSVCRTTGTP
jgi:hypothetical protein